MTDVVVGHATEHAEPRVEKSLGQRIEAANAEAVKRINEAKPVLVDIAPAREVLDPLQARGVVLLGGERPLVLVAVDWCEIRNEAYDRWRSALAEAAGTARERVLVSSVHQHDAPVADLEAERLLRSRNAAGSVCDPEFHDQAVRRVAASLRAALETTTASVWNRLP